MKEYDIYLNNSPIEYNIRLNNRLTEIDIFISSIPFYDDLTIFNKLIIGTENLDAIASRPLGEGASSITISQNFSNIIKNSIEEFNAEAVLNSFTLGEQEQLFEAYLSEMSLSSGVINLCYTAYLDGESNVFFDARLKELETHYSLGGGNDSLNIYSNIMPEGVYAKKFLRTENILRISQSLMTYVDKFICPQKSEASLNECAEILMLRRRYLSDMDTETLQSFDDISLNEVDYIIISN